MTVEVDRRVCTNIYDDEWQNMIWVPVIILILALASLGIIIKYFFDITHQFNKLKREFQKRKKAVEFTQEGVNKYSSATNERSLSLKITYQGIKKQNT